ncbi:MAG: hypothetical protein CMM94_04290 [Rickettsiales bacterium]|nr:hypothetical protein [Rickettsiales bacterium]
MASNKAIQLLLVEDSITDAYLVQEMLSCEAPGRFHIVNAPRLIDAFHLIEKRKFDAILLDLNLLDIDGIASVTALHNEKPHLPIVVYTGMDDPTLATKVKECGATGFLVKGRADGKMIQYSIEHALMAA